LDPDSKIWWIRIHNPGCKHANISNFSNGSNGENQRHLFVGAFMINVKSFVSLPIFWVRQKIEMYFLQAWTLTLQSQQLP
jgi:hypothetical protein